jgi:hypothetical protein
MLSQLLLLSLLGSFPSQLIADIDDSINRPSCEVGSRETATGKKLWNAIKDKSMNAVMSDYWRPYE